jgi:hypothetical protein
MAILFAASVLAAGSFDRTVWLESCSAQGTVARRDGEEGYPWRSKRWKYGRDSKTREQRGERDDQHKQDDLSPIRRW